MSRPNDAQLAGGVHVQYRVQVSPADRPSAHQSGVDQIEQPLIEWPTKSRRVMGPAKEVEEEDEVEKELSWRSRLSRGIS